MDADLLLLLDSCQALPQHFDSTGKGVAAVITATGFEHGLAGIAPGVGSHSFTNALVEVLGRISISSDPGAGHRQEPMCDTRLHALMVEERRASKPSLEKHPNGEFKRDAEGGLKMEPYQRRTPHRYWLSRNKKNRPIRLLPLMPLRGNEKGQCRQSSSEGDSNTKDSHPHCKPLYDTVAPEVLISVRLTPDALTSHDAEAWADWAVTVPSSASNVTFKANVVRIERLYRSYSSLVILKMPLETWSLLPKQRGMTFIGYVKGDNQAAEFNSIVDETISRKTSTTGTVEDTTLQPQELEPITARLPTSDTTSHEASSTMDPTSDHFTALYHHIPQDCVFPNKEPSPEDESDFHSSATADVLVKPNCGVASANSSEAASSATSTSLILPSTTDTPNLLAPAVPRVSSTTVTPASPSNTRDRNEETHPLTIAGQALAITEGLAAGVSLWDRAYDVLKEEEPNRVIKYEQLLSGVLVRGTFSTRVEPLPSYPLRDLVSSTPQAANETEDVADITNHVPQNDPIARREKLKKITELGLKHMEGMKLSTTILGHEVVLEDAVVKVAGAVEWVEAQVKDSIKDLPYATIVMAGVSLVLPLLKNPAAAEEASRDGFTYVTSQMRYFAVMESLLLPGDMKPDLKDDLTERLVDLYKLIIDFQVQNIIRFYRTRTKNFFRGAIKYDDWDQKLQVIKDTDAALVARFETAISARSVQELRTIAQEAQQSRKVLNDMLIKIRELVIISRDHLDFTRKMDRRMSDADNHACLQDLQTTNPWLDKERIVLDKGGLLRGSYSWILNNGDFQRLCSTGESRILWIKGEPGKGKTMLLCGIIDELVKSTPPNTNVSFFFCQATDIRINNATAVLRGLLYLLIKQQPSLISHIRERYDDSGKQCFEGTNAWVALSNILIRILNDGRLHDTYFVIDALDECSTGLDLLLNFVVRESAAHSNVKWIISSRNWPSIERGLHEAAQKTRLSLELNEKSISAAVDIYIRFKVDQLAMRNKYDSNTQEMVRHYLSSNANGTFLWVTLVCQQLVGLPGWKAQKKVTTFPPGLDELYKRMLKQIIQSDDADLCKSILAVMSVARRPTTLDELTAFCRHAQGGFC
ncbi:NACHT domain-containing protein [Rhypophila decipiens]|uniref:NACHT domain-containing protein n=1 Tax=Rhypophila decipiens TaxID=261697 RepID=A0AAN7B545_9PEZI|nr:NACHT domain-containing protein [Rhypophila decipiens]